MHDTRPIRDALLAPLNPEQREAVTVFDGPLAVIAGPGSGKTRVLTHRIAALVETGHTTPRNVLAVTFTNKAAGEMRERIETLLGEEQTSAMWILTFHSFCARFLRIEAEAAGLPRAYSILDTGDVRSVLRDVHNELGLLDDKAEIRTAAQQISRFKNGAGRIDGPLVKVYEHYQARLRRLGALDFDDLLLRTLEVLRENQEIRSRWQRRFTHVLVDEYQDTNPVQYAIVGLLAGVHRNICVVGDADQAIYGFRAATPAALISFTEDWPDARTVLLAENYRSSGRIIEVCQAIIDGNASALRPRLRTSNPDGDPVRIVITPDDRDEARFVASEAGRVRSTGTTAILFRTNAQTRGVEEALIQEGVPYVVVGALRFYERAEIKDAIAYLRLLCNPRDVLALSRAAAAPKRGLGPKSIMGVVDLADGGDLIEALRIGLATGTLTRGRTGWEQLLHTLDAAAAAADQDGAAAAVTTILDGGLSDHWRHSGEENWRERLENLDELKNAAVEFQTRHAGGVDENGETLSGRRILEMFLENIALSSSEDDSGTGANIPHLITAHASKGKEFAHVYIVGVEENLFPHGRRGEIVDEAEERRLMFVACSRAEKTLTLVRAERRLMHGNVVENPASRFLDDIEAQCETVDRRIGRSRTHGYGSGGTNRSARWGTPGAGPRSSGALRDAVRHAAPGSAPAAPRQAPGPRLAAVSVGDAVHHPAFGDGTVTAVKGDGDDTVVTIAFAAGPARQFKLSATPLSRRT